ncbi:pilus assembly protein TadE [Bifidobacterium aemilianum]|uniref:Pilus assembly protein TadE n=1 Tax=Bifidobacterium aemilianum TaxID=2493120 RepID=A0A366K677_9BIFI|nr:Rv3654c family TadE-like protein [Bifidobacterium aemilianum]RBP97245.1 pilus assembly protein TadE [Bifidobacterium aemilianum]
MRGGPWRFWGARDRGSGTMAGVMLILLAALLMLTLAAGGDLLVRKARVRALADLSAIVAASALREGDEGACSLAHASARANQAQVAACAIEDEDVTVTINLRTSFPLLPQLSYQSRAGPVDCGS